MGKIRSYPLKTDFDDQTITNVTEIQLKTIVSDDDTSVSLGLGTDVGDNFIVATDKLVVLGETAKRGFVGIGTATPSTQLDVAGGITATSGNDGTGTVAVRSGNSAQYSKVSLGTDSNKATVGVSGATDTFFTGVAQDDLVIRADDNNSKVHIGAGTSGPAAMVVTEVANVGKVGIGTTSPGTQLDVQDSTTSSANTGGSLRLSADDGAAMGDSHRLGVVEFGGAEDAGGSITVGARIEAVTDAAWSGSENGAALYFYTTDADASQSSVLKIDSNKKATFNGVIDITDTTDSSDATGDTGALRCEGGASIAKKLYVGTDADVDGTLETDALSIGGTVITATATELNYVDGVTSSIQTQLDSASGTTNLALAQTTVTGTTQTLVGSVYLTAKTYGTIRCMFGEQNAAHQASLKLVRFTGGATLHTFTSSAAPANVTETDKVVGNTDWYDIYLFTDNAAGIGICTGIQFD